MSARTCFLTRYIACFIPAWFSALSFFLIDKRGAQDSPSFCVFSGRLINLSFFLFLVRRRHVSTNVNGHLVKDWYGEFQNASEANQSLTNLTLNEHVHPVWTCNETIVKIVLIGMMTDVYIWNYLWLFKRHGLTK